jgi:hypothetical protein
MDASRAGRSTLIFGIVWHLSDTPQPERQASMTTIKTSPYATRQTEKSSFSHFAGTWEELEALTLANFDKARQGYKPGVLLVTVPADGFFSAVVNVTPEMTLETKLAARFPGEEPYMQTVAKGIAKSPAKVVEIVLYSHATLAEDGDASCEADYEIISVNARITEENEPMHPVAMMRNQKALKGGTKATYTSEQFADAIHYWSTRCMVSV